jgi:hypothetical protein
MVADWFLVPHQPFWAFRTGTVDLGRLDPFRLAAEGFTDREHNLALLIVVVASARGARSCRRHPILPDQTGKR